MNPAVRFPLPARPDAISSPTRRTRALRLAAGAVVAILVASCGSDSTDDTPSTTTPDSVSTPARAGVEPGLEPGSNFPADDAPGEPDSSGPAIGEPPTDNQGDLPGDTIVPE